MWMSPRPPNNRLVSKLYPTPENESLGKATPQIKHFREKNHILSCHIPVLKGNKTHRVLFCHISTSLTKCPLHSVQLNQTHLMRHLPWLYNVFRNKQGLQLQNLFLSKVHAQGPTMHCCSPARLLPYQDTLTAVAVMPLIRQVAFHIKQWKSEFSKFNTKLLIQVPRATSTHLQDKNSILLHSAQLWQCLPAKRDLKGYCSQSSPSSNKIKGTRQKKQPTPFSRAVYSCRILIHHKKALLPQNSPLLWYSQTIKVWVMYNRRVHRTRERWALPQYLWFGPDRARLIVKTTSHQNDTYWVLRNAVNYCTLGTAFTVLWLWASAKPSVQFLHS